MWMLGCVLHISIKIKERRKNATEKLLFLPNRFQNRSVRELKQRSTEGLYAPGSGEQALPVWQAGQEQQSFDRRVAAVSVSQCILDGEYPIQCLAQNSSIRLYLLQEGMKINSVPKYLTIHSRFLFWVRIFKVSCKQKTFEIINLLS